MSQDHVIRASCNFMGSSPSSWATILPSLVITATLVVELPRPLNQRVMRFDVWESLMVNHHPAEFGGHRHCASQDIMFLVAEEENSRCSCFNPPLLLISKTQGLKTHGISYYYLRSWSHALKAETRQIFENTSCQSVQKHWREVEIEKTRSRWRLMRLPAEHLP